MNSFNGFLNTLLVEKIIKVMVDGEPKWQVQSHEGKNLGTYPYTKEGKHQAHIRLGQVEAFKKKNESLDVSLSDVRKAVRLAIDKNSDNPNFSGCVNKFGREDVLTILTQEYGSKKTAERMLGESLTEGKITIKKYAGEYRVPSPDGTEDGAYYTDNKEDAIGSAIDMYKRAGFTITSSDISFRTVSDFDKYAKDAVDKVFKEDIDMQLQEESKDQEKWSEAMDKAEEKLGYRPKASDKKDDKAKYDKFYATATTIYKKLTSKSNVEKCADKLKESESDDWKHHNDGWDAHENDKPKSACPHKKGTKEYNDWKHGWETRNERYGHVDKEGKAKTDVYYSVNYQDKDFPAIQHKGTTDMVDSRTGKKVNRAYSWKRITKQAWEKMLDKIDK